jgi:hypothetical protein
MENGIIGLILGTATFVLLIKEIYRLLQIKRLLKWTIPIVISMSVIFIQGVTTGAIMEWTAMVAFWVGAGMLRALADGHGPQSEY